MADDTPRQADWRPIPDPTTLTTDSIRREIEHLRAKVEVQIQGLRLLLDERFMAQTRALEKAETATERRFESVNEFRAQLADQARNLVGRSEADIQHKALGDRITRIEETDHTHVTQAEYGQAHETLRQRIDANRDDIAEHKAWDIKIQGELQGALDSLKSRYAGVSVALGVIMTVIIVLITVIELTKK